MKWIPYADDAKGRVTVFISEDRHLLKADCLEVIPNCVYSKRIYTERIPEHVVVSQRNGFGYILTKKGKVKEQFSVIEVISSCAKAYYENEILNKFLQKTSKLYLAQDDGQLFIQNKNYCYFIAASIFDNYNFEGD